MRVLVVRPDQNPVVTEIGESLEAMQAVVGGYIQTVYPWKDEVALVCHEEGKVLGLPLNRLVIDEKGRILDYISGTFFIVGAPTDTDNFQSLPEEMIEKYKYLFGLKEMKI